MDYSLPIFLSAICIVEGAMTASVFAYLAFRYQSIDDKKMCNFKVLGGCFALLFCLFTNWLLEVPELTADNFTILGMGIVLTKLVLTISSSLLGYILTFDAIKSLERS